MKEPDTRQRAALIQDLFRRALERSEPERLRFLQQACDDNDIIEEVAELVRCSEKENPLLDAPVFAGAGGELAREALERAIPDRIGPYRIVGEIGRGGMGVVFDAVQDSPNRPVALKLLNTTSLVAGSEVVARFQLEAHVLGMLEHDGIARIYDAGTVDGALGPQPYFAMERIHGCSIRDYVERHRLSLTDRLELLARVADAIHYSHQKGVIHRDLKPSNILVTDAGQPKILDFGVARLAGGTVEGATALTRSGHIVGTLAYMSPEQAAGQLDEIDARSDIYSLGVIAYEALSGRSPLELTGLSLPEAVERVCTVTPPSLSSHDRDLRGDLATIVAHAMSKDPAERYEAASELAADLRRYLAHEPIVARPATAFHQLRLFAKRRRGLVAGLLIALSLLAAGTGGTIYGLIQAEARAADAERVLSVLTTVLTSGDLDELGTEARVLDALPIACAALEGLDDSPMVEARLRQVIGRAYLTLDSLSLAQPHLERSYELFVAHAQTVDQALALRYLGLFAMASGDFSRAEDSYRQALRLLEGGVDGYLRDYLEIRADLGYALLEQEEYSDVEGILSASLDSAVARFGPEDSTTQRIQHDLGLFYNETQRFEEAIPRLQELLTIRRQQLGDNSLTTLRTVHNLGMSYYGLGRLMEARELMLEATEGREEILGADHRNTLISKGNLGCIDYALEEYEQARDRLLVVVAARERLDGLEHPMAFEAANNLANTYVALEDYDAADELFRRLIEVSEKSFGAQSTKAALTKMSLGLMHKRRGDHVAAEALLAAAARDVEAALPHDHLWVGVFKANYAGTLLELEKFEAAEKEFLQAAEVLKASLPEGHARRIAVQSALVLLYDAWGKPERAAEIRAVLPEPTQSSRP